VRRRARLSGLVLTRLVLALGTLSGVQGEEHDKEAPFPQQNSPSFPFSPLEAGSTTFEGCVASHTDDRDGVGKGEALPPGLKGH